MHACRCAHGGVLAHATGHAHPCRAHASFRVLLRGRKLTDRTLEALAIHCRGLTALNVFYAPRMTAEGVVRLWVEGR